MISNNLILDNKNKINRAGGFFWKENQENEDLVEGLINCVDHGKHHVNLISIAEQLASDDRKAKGSVFLEFNEKNLDRLLFWVHSPKEEEWQYLYNENSRETIFIDSESVAITIPPKFYFFPDEIKAQKTLDIKTGSIPLRNEKSTGITFQEKESFVTPSYKYKKENFWTSPISRWYISIPEEIKPTEITTKIGPLYEASGFRYEKGFIVLHHDPWELWPDGVLQISSYEPVGSSIRHYALRSNRCNGSGSSIANYLRHSQNPRSLIKAGAEHTGLRWVEEDTSINSVEHHSKNWIYFLNDGSKVCHPGKRLYDSGDTVYDNSVFGNIINIRNKETHGEGWYMSRYWSERGIDSKYFFPRIKGLKIKDTFVDFEINSIRLPGLRRRLESFKLILGQNQDLEDKLWSYLDSNDSITKTSRSSILYEIYGNNPDKVNPLEIFMKTSENWVFCVESDLKLFKPSSWRGLRDFIEREKPLGSIAIVEDVNP